MAKKRDLGPSALFEISTFFPAGRSTSKEERKYLIYMSHTSKCAAETCVSGIKESAV